MSGVYRLRQAKGTYPVGGNPRRFDNTDAVVDEKIRPARYQNNTVIQDAGLAPKKVMPTDIAQHNTPPPTSYAQSTGIPGKIRGRQSDKSSKSK